ncbi:MAG TPA: hypothetical protein VLA73_01575, partial [Burkholderiales bacterium]|nr:hypothetical protein [Burkholderiales bacterium]
TDVLRSELAFMASLLLDECGFGAPSRYRALRTHRAAKPPRLPAGLNRPSSRAALKNAATARSRASLRIINRYELSDL